MNSSHLNEHDANQGAQSSGEFLGMTGNSGWYLLGSGGMTIMMVIVLWGVLGVSLLLCLLVGLILCLASLAYVFTLKNGKPAHYDMDFFESALVEAGVLQFSFGPRAQTPANPFRRGPQPDLGVPANVKFAGRDRSAGRRSHREEARAEAASTEATRTSVPAKTAGPKPEPAIAQSEYDCLEEKLNATEELLEEALAGEGET